VASHKISIGFQTDIIGKSFFKISFSSSLNSVKVTQYFFTASVAKVPRPLVFVIIAKSFGTLSNSTLLKSSIKAKNSSKL
jgi:hypothetical protein